MRSICAQLIAIWTSAIALVAVLGFTAMGDALRASEGASPRLIAVAAGLVVVLLALAGSLWWFVRRLQVVFRDMSSSLRRLGQGDLEVRLALPSCTETDALAENFHDAVSRLQELLTRVRAASRQMRVAADEISQGHGDLAARTERQASSLEETASAMEEMTVAVSHNADNAKRASEHALAAKEVATRGGQAVAMVVGTMEGISDSSKRISEIIGVIDGIAFQTNILALNAAVEAARAGEQGRGFAVVAAEVRSLAQRSAGASKEIRQLILGSAGKVDEGAAQVEHAGETMAEIVDAVKRVTDLVSEISAASREQSQSLHQVSETVQQLERVTQQNAALVEQASAASASVREQAESLAHAVGRFRLHASADAAEAPSAGPGVAPRGRLPAAPRGVPALERRPFEAPVEFPPARR